MTAVSQIVTNLCRFCSLGDRIRPAIWDQCLVCDGNVRVFPTKGAIVAPWLLIVPGSHVPSASRLPQQEKLSVGRLIRNIQHLSASAGKSLVIFENGSPHFGADVSCGIEHVHIHMVALEFSLIDKLRLHLPEKIEAPEPWSSLATPSDTPYIFVNDGHNNSYFDASDAPSQFVRQLIATDLDRPDEFHYDLFPQSENVAYTVGWFERISKASLMLSTRSNF
jgi:ATP adenylyltransferase